MLKRSSFVIRFVVTTLLLALPFVPQAQNSTPQLGRDSVKSVVAAMTIEEKAKLLVGMGYNLDIPGVTSDEDKKTREKVVGAAGRTHAIPRLGIPSLTLADGPAGVRIKPTRDGDS